MTHDNLENFYKTNFAMKQHHGWDIHELEDLACYERAIYVGLLMKHLKDIEDNRQRRGRG